MTIGQRLREAREAHQMSIGDVARRTYIQPKFIQAIEEDNLGVIPASHRKFFVRDYARVVAVDPEEILAELSQEGSTQSTASPRPQRERFRERNSVSPGPPAATFGDDNERVADDGPVRPSFGSITLGEREGPGNISYWLIGAAVLLLAGLGIYYFFFREEGGGEPPVAAGTGIDTGAVDPAAVLSSGNGEVDSAAPTPSTDGDSLTLEGRAVAPVWYTIVMDSKRSETGTLDSGGTKTWRAMKNFKVSLGNAGGLELFLNERPLGALGPRRSVVRNQMIDSSGVVKRPARRTSTRPTTTRRPTTPRVREITPTEMRPPSGN